MIIDLILDRQDGLPYNPKTFYDRVMGYDNIGWGIAQAMDDDSETAVKHELSTYIINGNYNPDIIKYIKSVKWL